MSSLQDIASHPFPLIRGGGLFLLVVGASIVAGAFARRFFWKLFIAGLVVASVLVMASAKNLAAPFGAPTAVQIWSLVVAVSLEAIVLLALNGRLRVLDERRRILVILAVVGAHFLVMTPAFGPLVAVLGLLSVVNAMAGLYLVHIPLSASWFIDGALKAGVGGLMFCCAPRVSW